ncbi:MAG: hypothetical protein O7C75_03225 [Verrucomicrobia bacterium]|nr:hypothetical protein [Verrucomicrobiota bacterium]
MKQKMIAAYEEWQADFVRLQEDGGWEDHHQELRENLIESIGGLPERTPLHARVTGSIERPDFRVEKILFESRPGFYVTANLYLPLLDLRPAKQNQQPPLVFVSSTGAAASLRSGLLPDKAARSGRRVIAVDPRGIGETAQKSLTGQGRFFGSDQEDVAAAYVLGESYLGLRTEDISRAVRYAAGNHAEAIELYAEGQMAVAALHAAFLEPDLISGTQLKNSLVSWESILVRERSFQQLANVVHGCLLHYDLPQLANELEGHLEMILPVDSLGLEILPEGAPLPPGYHDPDKPGLVGTFFSKASFLNPQGEFPLYVLSVDYDNAIEKRGNDWSGIWSGHLLGTATGNIELRGQTDQALSITVDGNSVLTLEDFTGTRSVTVKMEKGSFIP